MSSYVLDIDGLDATMSPIVGGKGANLGELSRIEGIDVPPGFCVTTEAYRRVVETSPAVRSLVDRLAEVHADDHAAIRSMSAHLREVIVAIPVPDDVAAPIDAAITRFGAEAAFAVRSSATAEDLPTASFAGQQDSYLGIVGPHAILEQIVRCWSSLHTERAVTYRARKGISRDRPDMAVVVQRMVDADASGVLFTADPVSGSRAITSIEAVPGPGEALVAGRVRADSFRVRADRIVAADRRHDRPTLDDAQALELAALGRSIEAHFGRPQDIEWCLAAGTFRFVQARPITTLFPTPVRDDDEIHVYVSVGHGQMMTDPMRPLGLSMWKLMALPPMWEAAGRLFVDVTAGLASPATRSGLLATLGTGDPLIGDALQTIVDRGDILPPAPVAPPVATPASPPGPAADPVATDPAIVDELIATREAAVTALRVAIAGRSGTDLLDFILEDIAGLKRVVFEPVSHQVVMGGMEAAWWLNDHLAEWLGEVNAADVLSQSLDRNVTAEMGRALLGVADAIRPHAEVVERLRAAPADDVVDRLDDLPGGAECRVAIDGFLDRYGMRCVGEIDITRTRWAERPAALLALILGNVKNFEPGAGERHVEQGLEQARGMELDLLTRLRELPDGDRKADETKGMIDRLRTFGGFREYPKFFIVSCFFVYKRALLAEVDRLVAAGALRRPDDAFFLTFQELRDVVAGGSADLDLIDQRAAAYQSYWALTPPRVLTSEGEVFAGRYRRDDAPVDALVGLAVSSGTIEGRARVLHDIEEAHVEPGDILVTAFTDPSWSPLFVAIAGLVTEVGGLMTHGAVIAREYGLPAVVGVERATQLIEDGRRIRVHGTDGYVELLD